MDKNHQSPSDEQHEHIRDKDQEAASPSRETPPDGPAFTLDFDTLNDPKRNRRLVRRFDLRILPLCSWVYLLNYLDRGNIGNAKVLNAETNDDMLSQTNMSATDYAVAVSLFSLAYALFEVPSNWVMKRYVRPSLWLGFLLFSWGVVTIGFAGVQNFATVVVLRFMIGAFEAGFFPGVIYLITFFYRREERSLRIAFVVAHANLAGAFGGSIGYGMGKLNGVAGLEGFRWLFIIEGLITAVCTVLLVFFLPDYPSTARWLSPEEKIFAEERLQIHGGGYTNQKTTKHEILETVVGWRMLAHYFTYIVDVIPLGSFTFFAPTIVTGLGYTSIEAQLMIIPPWIVGYVAALLVSYSSDHFNARGYHIAFNSIIGGAGWLGAACLPADAYNARYACLCIAAIGAFPVTAPLSAWVTCNVPAIPAMAYAIALNNSTAGFAQIISQWIWLPSEAARGYPTGNSICAACSFVVAAMSIGLRLQYGKMNRNNVLDASGKPRTWAL